MPFQTIARNDYFRFAQRSNGQVLVDSIFGSRTGQLVIPAEGHLQRDILVALRNGAEQAIEALDEQAAQARALDEADDYFFDHPSARDHALAGTGGR